MAAKAQTKTEKEQIEQVESTVPAKVSYYEGIGRRKVSTARARLYVVADSPITIKGTSIGKGDIIINGKAVEKYFPGEIMKKMYMEPFRTTNTISRFAVSVTTSGGGSMGQMGSFILAISRAFVKVEAEKFRPILKKRGFMTRDPRAKQRRKAGYAGKARARKQSPKR